MGRSPCSSESGLKKGPWTPEEDQLLLDYINKHGHGSWRALPILAGLNRCGKSCRLRWTNYLRPDIKRGKFSDEEERIIINLHSVLGNKWSKIATHLPGRTDNEIKNFWNTHLRKKLLQMGIDPKTHKPITDLNLLVNLSHLLSHSNLAGSMNPWNNALRFQAEATQLANIQLLQNLMQVMNTGPLPKFEEPNLSELHNFNQSDGLATEMMNQYTIDPFHEPWNFQNSNFTPKLPCDHHVATNLSSYFENGSSGACNTQNHLFPALVSVSPETSTTNQRDSKNLTPIHIHSSNSNIFQDWEKLVDDGSNSSFWKDIIDS
ncbi:hypothetical protein RJ640_017817 [Escallonia rubra]|uniref:Uncharacterized protein n=1 Tax=Escallonia rubra TaxID=112253 RepID=A0AA88S181_9ASTE|nr:hypothetical protein RJ640_017817 [Escallonia rubra]